MKFRICVTSVFIALLFSCLLQASSASSLPGPRPLHDQHSTAASTKTQKYIQSLSHRFQILKLGLAKSNHDGAIKKTQTAGAHSESDKNRAMLVRLFSLQQEMSKAAQQSPAQSRQLIQEQKQIGRMIHDVRNQQIQERIIAARTRRTPQDSRAATLDHSKITALKNNRLALRQQHEADKQKVKAHTQAQERSDPAIAIQGTVVDDEANAPLHYIEVDIFDSTGSWIDYGYTDDAGSYSIANLPTGTYYARTYNDSGFINEVYNNISCLSECDILAGTPIGVTAGTTTGGIDIALRTYGRITGRLTTEGENLPVSWAEIDIFDTNGDLSSYGYSDETGNYSASFLSPGNYYVRSNTIFSDELYDNVPCENSCNLSEGTVVPVQLQTTTVNIDFALPPGGAITGTVTDAATGSSLADNEVRIFDASGNEAGYSYTDSSGIYRIPALKTGNYYSVVYNYDGYVNELYNDKPCPDGSCDPLSGTPIPVTEGITTPSIDFALDRGGVIHGHISGAHSQPLPDVQVDIYNTNGDFVSYGYTDSLGNYSAGSLTTGTYYARTAYAYGYIDKLYKNINCDPECNVTSGTPISVSLSSTTFHIDFTLDPGATIGGKITDAGTGAPLDWAWVDIFNSAGDAVAYGYTDEAGNYSVPGLSTGDYFALASNYSDYLSQLYKKIDCSAGCDPTAGKPIAATAGSTKDNIDFALEHAGTIQGQVTDSSTGMPISYSEVDIYDSTGNYTAYAYTDEAGNYNSGGLANGNYYLQTAYSGHLDELYDNLPCKPYCDPLNGTAVPVSADTASTADFSLGQGATISGNITASDTGLPIEDAGVEIYDADGNYAASGWTDSSGNYDASGLLAGSYHAVTRNYSGYVNELYDNLPCDPYCDLSAGASISVASDATTPGIDFALSPGGVISGNVSTQTGALPDTGIDIYSSTGDWTAYGYTDSEGNYSVGGLAGGNYFAATDDYSGNLNELYDNIPCQYCDPTIGTSIPVVAAQTTTGIDFMLDAGGNIAGKVTDANTGLPLQSVSLLIYDAQGNEVGYGYSNFFGLYNISGLTAGTYYARTYNGSGYADEIFNDLSCSGDCDPLSGTPITVTAGNDTDSIDFSLRVGGKISGKVTDAGTGHPIEWTYVDIFDSAGNYSTYGYTDESGSYVVSGLQNGTYYAMTGSDSVHSAQLYYGIPCPSGCDVTTGSPVSVALETVTCDINFSLENAPTAIIFSDDFEDGNYDAPTPSWSTKGGAWQVVSGNAVGTVTKKGMLLSPDFGGCSVCAFDANMNVQKSGRVSLFGWYQDGSHNVEVRLMQDKNKLFVKQKNGGKSVKTTVELPITAGANINVKAVYDGANILVFIDGVLKATLSSPMPPSGNAAFYVKSTTGSPITGALADIKVY